MDQSPVQTTTSPLKKRLTAIVWLVIFGTLFLMGRVEADETRSPNVLMICIDDLNDWVGFLGGHPQALTPNMDALARRGVNFTNAHCVVPVCSPSRISVISGTAPTTHGSYELGPKFEELPALRRTPTMHRYFKDHGYVTITGGKVLHHNFGGRLAQDIDRNLGRTRSPRPKMQLNRPADWSAAWDWGAFPQADESMADFQLSQEVARTLKRPMDQPFFMSVGFFRPHVPLYVPPKWFELYPPSELKLTTPASDDLDHLPPNFLNINQYAVAPTHQQVIQNHKQQGLTQAYLASISFVDHCVGVVLDALEKGPHRDNTILLLWSDHGFHLGEKHHWAKRTLWEESTRVPLLFSGPGITAGQVCHEPVSLLDLFPSLVELCHLPTNERNEGVSLGPQLRRAETPRDRPAISSSYAGNHAVRSRDWRLIVYDDGQKELYHHKVDPQEHHNLADHPDHLETQRKLMRWLPKDAAPEFKRKSERPYRSRVNSNTPPPK